MPWSTVFYASEINFLTGFAEICLFAEFQAKQDRVAKVLWGTRMIALSILFGVWSYSGFGWVCGGLLIFSLVIYSVSSSLGSERAKKESKTESLGDLERPFYLAHISVINWVLAIPFSLGPGTHRERGVWLFINLVTFAIVAGVYFTDGPMRTAWGCYPPSVDWNDIGSAGICPQSPKGSYLTCNTPPVKTSAFLACQSFDWVESLGQGGIRVAILLAAISVGVYIASIRRNMNRALEELEEANPDP